MGLVGLFLNKTLLKVLLLGAAIFLLLRLLTWFLSLASGLGWIPMLGLILITLIVSRSLAAKNSRPRVFLNSITFLFFTFLTFILILNVLAPLQIPFPLGAPIKLALASLPSLMYFAYHRNLWSWRRISFFHKGLQHNKRLSMNDLLPRGIEEGHITYNAGSKGFRVLKFIEVKQHHEGKEPPANTQRIHEQIAATLTRQLNTMRRLGIEVSYELHCHNGASRVFLSSISEGRDYRRCRSIVDECSSLLARTMKSFSSTTISTKSLDESNRAKRVLMLPVTTNVENVLRVENDDYNVRIIRNSDSERPARLRLVHLTNVQSLCLKTKARLLDELAHLARTHKPTWDFTCILHIKPLSDGNLDEEFMEISKKQAVAIMQVSEELKYELLSGKRKNRKYLNNHGDAIPNPRQEAQNTNINLERLRIAKRSGYFEVSITIISEPATAESVARRIKYEAHGDDGLAELSIDRLPPWLLKWAIRRHHLRPTDKVTGEELTFLAHLPENLFEDQTKSDEAEPTKLPTGQIHIDIAPSATKR